MKEKKCIVTVMNSISETSMPYNEFVLYRNKVSPEDRQIVIACTETIPSNIQIPDGLKVFCAGRNGKKITNIMSKVEKECRVEKRKLIVHLHQPKSAMLFNLRTFKKGYRKRTVFTIHSLYSAYSGINKVLSVFTSICVKKVTCVSEAAYHEYPNFIKRIKKQDMIVIKNGVDLKRIDSVNYSKKGKVSREKTLIYVARMIPLKNHKFLINVLSKLNRCKLVLIGAEDRGREIRKIIDAEGLNNRVKIIGQVSRIDVFKQLKQADIYVSPSRIEGLPISVLEAMSVGLPVILSDIQPHLEIGVFDKSILTIPLEEKQWIETINDYLNMNHETLIKIGENCKRCAQKHFSLDKMLEKFDKLYEKM